jgi:hypothetical protein
MSNNQETFEALRPDREQGVQSVPLGKSRVFGGPDLFVRYDASPEEDARVRRLSSKEKASPELTMNIQGVARMGDVVPALHPVGQQGMPPSRPTKTSVIQAIPRLPTAWYPAPDEACGRISKPASSIPPTQPSSKGIRGVVEVIRLWSRLSPDDRSHILRFARRQASSRR